MTLLKSLKNVKLKKSVVTIGVFDGVHIGHVRVIRNTVARARKIKASSVVVTFDPHPAKIVADSSRVPSLISLAHRIRLISALGVDYIVVMKFTKSVADISAERFVKDVLSAKLGMREIYIGENFYFGKRGTGTGATLDMLGRRFGFKPHVVKSVRRYGRIVSSSFIRNLIISGDHSKASALLARPVSILGTVVRGYGRGRILGFPTANINPHHEALPPYGVYAVKVNYDGKIFGGILNIGLRPTFFDDAKDSEPTIEVHIFDFHRKIYGKDIEILFVKKLRKELKFDSKEALLAQITRDVIVARRILA